MNKWKVYAIVTLLLALAGCLRPFTFRPIPDKPDEQAGLKGKEDCPSVPAGPQVDCWESSVPLNKGQSAPYPGILVDPGRLAFRTEQIQYLRGDAKNWYQLGAADYKSTTRPEWETIGIGLVVGLTGGFLGGVILSEVKK